MTVGTKDSAIAELNALINEIKQLKNERRDSANHTRWGEKTLAFLEEVFGQDSRYYLRFASFRWSRTVPFTVGGPADPEGSWDLRTAMEREHHTAYLEQLETSKGLLQAATDHLTRVDNTSAVYKGKDTNPESSLILRVINLAEQQLRKTIHDTPSRETEIQDAYANLLIGADIPYTRETETVEYSSKTYRPDFVIQKIDLAIEIKLCAREGREKKIIAEINDDILAYRTKFGNLLFIVYDAGFIRDVDCFSDDFEKNENVIVKVIKH